MAAAGAAAARFEAAPGRPRSPMRCTCPAARYVPEGVGSCLLGDAGTTGDAPPDAPGAVPVEPSAICGQEDRSFAALADGQVNRAGGTRCQRDGDDIAALARDHQRTVSALGAESLGRWSTSPRTLRTTLPRSSGSQRSLCEIRLRYQSCSHAGRIARGRSRGRGAYTRRSSAHGALGRALTRRARNGLGPEPLAAI